MPRNITVTFSDGSTHVYQGAPDDVTPEQVESRAAKEFGKKVTALDGGRGAAKEPPVLDDIKQGAGNIAAGLVRGAGSIGATLLYPIDKAQDLYYGDRGPNVTGLVTGKQPLSRNEERRRAMDEGLQMMGAEPDSALYKVGKIGGEIAGTAGAGGAVANVLGRAAPALAAANPNLLAAIRTAGMEAGSATGMANPLLRVAGGAANGAVSAGMVDPSEAGLGAMVGGALPLGLKVAGSVGRAIGAAVRGGGASPEVVNLANKAEQLGINIPADRLVDSKPLNRLAAALNYVPFSGRATAEKEMGAQLNSALSKTFGQASPNVTQALRQAETQLGGQFDNFLKSNTVNVDQQFLTDLADSANRAGRELGSDGASIIGKQVDDIIAKAGTGQIDGQAAYNIKRVLDRIGNRNSPEAWYALDLKGKLMDALNRSVGPQQAQDFATLRQQYGNMLEIQKLAKNGADGEISVARLANLKDIRSPELQDLADIAAQFVKGRESSHGAAQLASFGLGGLAGYAGPAAFAGTVAAGRGANAALNSNALRNFVLQQPGQANALSRLVGPQIRQIPYRVAPAIAGDQ